MRLAFRSSTYRVVSPQIAAVRVYQHEHTGKHIGVS